MDGKQICIELKRNKIDMRILHILRPSAYHRDSRKNPVHCLARAQEKEGHSTKVLTLDTLFHRLANQQPDQPINASEFWRPAGRHENAMMPASVSQLCGFDIIHVHTDDLFADLFPCLQPFHRTPLVLSMHRELSQSTFIRRLKQLYFNTVKRISLHGYNRIIACSVEDLALCLPLCLSRLHVIEEGADIEKFSNLGPLVFNKTFLFVGRLSDTQRLSLLLKTIYHIKFSTPDIRLTIIDTEGIENQASITRLIDNLQLGENVNVRRGLDDTQIKMEIARHCFTLCASDDEGFGSTLVECMAGGLIPVATSTPRFRRIMDRAGVGQAVDFNAPEAAANSILAYLRSMAANYRIARKKAIAASARYGWAETARRQLRVYEEVLGSQSRTNYSRGAVGTTSGGLTRLPSIAGNSQGLS